MPQRNPAIQNPESHRQLIRPSAYCNSGFLARQKSNKKMDITGLVNSYFFKVFFLFHQELLACSINFRKQQILSFLFIFVVDKYVVQKNDEFSRFCQLIMRLECMNLIKYNDYNHIFDSWTICYVFSTTVQWKMMKI